MPFLLAKTIIINYNKKRNEKSGVKMESYKLKPWQKVIFRNYGTVKTELIGKVVGLSESEVVFFAKELGLDGIEYNPAWVTSGFVTVIRNNWDLLTIEDIATILETSVENLNKLLVEYDFLNTKLGLKPKTPDVKYSALSEMEKTTTERVKAVVLSNYLEQTAKPFDFFNNYVEPKFSPKSNPTIKDRFVSSYSAKYSGALLDDNLSDYSDDYLEKLASTGTNGIWLSDTLRNLAEFPFDKSLSPDYEIRVKNLKKLTERCEKHGVKVYLYINEPRSLPESFFEKYPNLKGERADDGTYCLCTSKKEVQDYLYNAVKSLAESVPKLYAVMTITMSENPTHCYSRPLFGIKNATCPECLKRKPQEVVAEVNNIIAKGLRDGNGYTRLIANVWGWANYSAEDKKEVFETIDLLDKSVDVLCVSEYGKEFTRGGVKGKVDDYSISVLGPSEFFKNVIKYAKESGHNVWAKIQINCSWECSAVPYVPTFGLMSKHVNSLKELGVGGLMLGWSLGGYPGGALPLINTLSESENFNDEEWYNAVYGTNAELIFKAVKTFDTAFTNYPFSVDGIYFGGHNMGPGNLWALDDGDRVSTMVCFTFGDLNKWTAQYGTNIYISLMSALCSEWKKGLDSIKNVQGNSATKEFVNCAKTAYIHFRSALNLAIFSSLKKDALNNKQTLINCLDSELEITKELYGIIANDAKIGFEMTNHYYYNQNLLLEKILNVLEIKEQIKNT